MAKKRKTQATGNGAEKLSISLPGEMAAWLRRSAAKKPGATISQEIRNALMPLYEKRHAK